MKLSGEILFMHLYRVLLFNDTVISSDHMTLNIWGTKNNWLQMLYKKVVMAWFEVLI